MIRIVPDVPSNIAQGRPGDSPDVLFVQAAQRRRLLVAEQLTRGGMGVVTASDLAEGLRLLSSGQFVMAVLDLSHDRAAVTAVRLIRSRYPGVTLVGVVDPNNPAIAAEAMAAGLSDLLPWPLDLAPLDRLLVDARDRAAAAAVTGEEETAFEPVLFAQSPAMRDVVAALKAEVASRTHVCFAGEAGTGRAFAAETLHRWAGGRPDGFITIDCAGADADELEQHLFGTSAPAASDPCDQVTAGCAVNRAQGGTLLLRHVTDAPARVQARLARILRDQEVRVDASAPGPFDVRVMVSTDSDVDALIEDGRLGPDLAARVATVRIDIPPFRRRGPDIPLLLGAFAQQVAMLHQIAPKSFSRSALALLSALPWRGNAGEMRVLVETLMRSITRRVIQLEDVLEHTALEGFAARVDAGGSLREARARFERECISAMLMRHHGRVGEAAKALGIQRTNLYRKVRQLKVPRALLSPRR